MDPSIGIGSTSLGEQTTTTSIKKHRTITDLQNVGGNPKNLIAIGCYSGQGISYNILPENLDHPNLILLDDTNIQDHKKIQTCKKNRAVEAVDSMFT